MSGIIGDIGSRSSVIGEYSGDTLSFLVGMIASFGVATAPTGWIICNGAAVSRTVTYAALFGVIGTAWGVGDGSSTFNLPDLRAAFLRGAGTSTIFSEDHATTFGAVENDQLQGHYHRFHAIDDYSSVNSNWNNGRDGGANSSGYVLGVYEPITDGTNGTPRVGLETRPNNIGVNYCIKF